MPAATADDQEELLATTNDALRHQAIRRLKKRRDLKTHVVVYVLFNAVVWGVWAVIGASSHSWWPWPLFLTLFWGVGLVMNAWEVYFRRPVTEEQLRAEIERLDPSR